MKPGDLVVVNTHRGYRVGTIIEIRAETFICPLVVLVENQKLFLGKGEVSFDMSLVENS